MRIKAGDVVLVAVLLLCCAALFLAPHLKKQPGGLTAQLIVDGEVRETVVLSSLDGEVTRTVNGCTVVFSPNDARFESADCPDGLCVKQGRLKAAGDTAVCLPNRVVVTLIADGESTDGGKVDAVAY
ncbi:MAG: NusG domain II-containing protein [Clostridia bacterium]|nr:NusG domain II-containing protein [Clostridia bacterium]